MASCMNGRPITRRQPRGQVPSVMRLGSHYTGGYRFGERAFSQRLQLLPVPTLFGVISMDLRDRPTVTHLGGFSPDSGQGLTCGLRSQLLGHGAPRPSLEFADQPRVAFDASRRGQHRIDHFP